MCKLHKQVLVFVQRGIFVPAIIALLFLYLGNFYKYTCRLSSVSRGIKFYHVWFITDIPWCISDDAGTGRGAVSNRVCLWCRWLAWLEVGHSGCTVEGRVYILISWNWPFVLCFMLNVRQLVVFVIIYDKLQFYYLCYYFAFGLVNNAGVYN